MGSVPNDQILQSETTCGSLLYELQKIWDEVGETETSRDKMLYELEQECLDVYRRKVDHANRSRAQLRQAIADSEAEIAAICSGMGELPVHTRQTEKKAVSLEEELSTILPELDEMRKRKVERKNQFVDVICQIQKLSTEIYGVGCDSSQAVVDESDLSLRRFEELQKQLQSLQIEKSERLKQVMEHLSVLSSLCSVLGLDFKETVRELHPSLADGGETSSISTETLELMQTAIDGLRELKLQRMQRLQDHATMLVELWNLMDTPVEEQLAFQNVTCKIAASEDEITEPNMLSGDFIKHVEEEVFRLEALKSSKMKELVLKKRAELKELCRKTHLFPEGDGDMESLIAAIETGALDPSSVLEQIEMEVAKVKEEAFSRNEILEKVEKWLSAREEEEWLEEYNMDENRYNAGRGAHLILKRAEKARILVNKLPGMVEAVAGKALSWESERGVEFMYDGIRLLSMLGEYMIIRQEKEEEKKRRREQKKLHGQFITEQEAIFGSKPSPVKSGKKSRMSMGGGGGGGNNRRLSVGGNMIQTPRPVSSHSTRATPNSRLVKKDDKLGAKTNARRALDITNPPARNYTSDSRESESVSIRTPFSPVSSTASLRPYHDQNILQNDTSFQKSSSEYKTPQKTVLKGDSVYSTPSKVVIHATEEENRTPNMKTIPIPTTPLTVSSLVQTGVSPAPALSVFGGSPVEERDDEIEYSFEERRAGFVVPRVHLKRGLLV